jgi:putative ABC transport system permease protein
MLLVPAFSDPSTAVRARARLRVPGFSWLDFKVGFRMLARYPGLTLVGTVAIAVAIALGTLYFEALNKWQHPRLPIAHPERVVSIRDWDMSAMRTEGKALPDFAVWREQVKRIDHLGAAIIFARNLVTEDGHV